jgi:WD40 repeat protein
MFSADNKVLAAEYSDGRDILWDMDTGAPMFLPIVEEEAVIALSLSSDNKTVAWISAARNANLPSSNSAGSDVSKERNLVLWRFRTNDPPQVLIQKGVQSLTGVAFSNDGKLLATSDKDGNATLWDVKTGNKTADLQNAQSQRSRLRRLSLAFSPDDRMLIVANPAFGLTFWNLITGQVFDDPITDNTRRVSKMSFSSGKDGPIMASSGFGSRIVLWDLNTRQPLGVITPSFSTDHSLSHNGTFLLVSGKELVYWDVSVEAWLTVACQIANRDLTEPEWKNYVGNEASFRKTCTR